MVNESNESVVMFDTENSIILCDYLDLLLNRTMDLEEAYGEKPTEGAYIKCKHEKLVQNPNSKLGQYEHILYADQCEKISVGKEKEMNDPLFIYSGGIRIPHYHGTEKMDEGSGNLVISGKPGVGKSTMAFQFAAACASEPNNGIAVYFSLDVDEKQIVKSMKCSGDGPCVNYLCDYSLKSQNGTVVYDDDSNKGLEAMLRNVLCRDEDGKIVPQIVLPKLCPRGISPDADAKQDVIFLQRIKELQKLLRAINSYNMTERRKKAAERDPLVKLAVVDSLDVFGERMLTREEINRLFMLFKQYGLIGVFTMGSAGYESLALEDAYKASVTYQADVVIELKKEFYNNYTCSYFEILKSRYIRHVLGHHPYKVENYKKPPETEQTKKQRKDLFFFKNTDRMKYIVVLPSLHYRIGASENSVFPSQQRYLEQKEEKDSRKQQEALKTTEEKEMLFGINEMRHILPNHFKDRSMAFPQIITISGSSGLYKSDLALNALISGIVDSEQNGLIVRLGDRDAFAVRGVRLEEKLLERTLDRIRKREAKELNVAEAMQEQKSDSQTDDSQSDGSQQPQQPENEKKEVSDKIYFYEKGEEIIHNDEPNKYTLKGWSIDRDEIQPQLLEVTFKNGALLPEEFVDEICGIINRYKIRRVVFVDLKYIGSSYPFLVNSDTSGDLFLSAFVHIMRNYGTHVIMSSSESGLEVSNVELSKAGILADAILTCTASKTPKGGYDKVYISGEGLITKQDKNMAKINTKEKSKYELAFCNEKDRESIQSVVKLCAFCIEFESSWTQDDANKAPGKAKAPEMDKAPGKAEAPEADKAPGKANAPGKAKVPKRIQLKRQKG